MELLFLSIMGDGLLLQIASEDLAGDTANRGQFRSSANKLVLQIPMCRELNDQVRKN